MKIIEKTGTIDAPVEGRARKTAAVGKGTGRKTAPPDRAVMAMRSLHSLQCLQLFKLKM
ncbi:MAG: hypothetical protein P9M00_10685 [Candidatus Tritonobacter lacicola]|nr:hypothetical protein [Candidatus Tritonobacter lacicola]